MGRLNFRNDLFYAGLTGDQSYGAGRDAEPSWLDDRQTQMGREAALITKLAQLRLGDAFVENGDETGTGTEDGARPLFLPLFGG